MGPSCRPAPARRLCALALTAFVLPGAFGRPAPSVAPPGPLTAEYRFSWAGLEAGRASIRLKPGGAGRFEVRAEAATTGAARALWEMDATFRSDPSLDTFLPSSAELIERYPRRRVETRLTFTSREVRRDRRVVRNGQAEGRPRTFKVAGAHDLAGALLAVRARELRTGEVHHLDLFPGSAPYRATARVVGRETVRVLGLLRPAIRVELELHQIGRDGSLTRVRKFRGARAWLSDDDDRIVLKAQADVFIGAVSAVLVRIDR